MQLRVLYFARLRDALGRNGEQLELPDASTVATLIESLSERGGPWSRELASGRAVRVAVNQEVAPRSTALCDGDEVALFPPVTGG
jgi:molybdopterin synthase sulfur carrier subunit